MKVLVIGSGGREHALVWKIAQSPLVKKIFAAPGNAGIAELAECMAIKQNDFDGLVKFAKENEIGLTVVGPEQPLVDGIVDRFKDEGLKIFGPNHEAARLEGSKIFSKQSMERFGVPTAAFRIFSDPVEAKKYIVHAELPLVVKASGLAAGKGVTVCNTAEEAINAVTKIMEDKIFGDAGAEVVVEECLVGDEMSVLAFTDGTEVLALASSQDHKRAFDKDEGPNTGGMGAYSPYPLINGDQFHEVVDQTVKPVVEGLRKEGVIYQGLIYAGIMMTKKGPRVLEYNVRFGDPETQAILPRMKDDIVPLFLEIAEGHLKTKKLHWDERSCITIVMASQGYPAAYATGYTITGLNQVDEEGVTVFQAGTKSEKSEVVTSGGRVLAVSALGETLKAAQEKAYRVIHKIKFEGCHFRTDIGKRVLDKEVKATNS